MIWKYDYSHTILIYNNFKLIIYNIYNEILEELNIYNVYIWNPWYNFSKSVFKLTEFGIIEESFLKPKYWNFNFEIKIKINLSFNPKLSLLKLNFSLKKISLYQEISIEQNTHLSKLMITLMYKFLMIVLYFHLLF